MIGFLIGLGLGLAIAVVLFFVVKNNLKKVLAAKAELEAKLASISKAADAVKNVVK
jgi:hypothetical protein